MSTSPSLAGPAPVSIASFAAELHSHYYAMGYGASTIGRMRHVLEELVERTGIETAADLDDDAISRFVESRPFDQGDHTFYTNLSALRAVCWDAYGLGLISSFPRFPRIPQVRDRTPNSPEDRTGRVLSPQDVECITTHLSNNCKTWEDHRLYALTATVVSTGLLKNEALRLRVADCDLEARTIWVMGRDGGLRPETVRISSDLAQVLAGWLPRIEESLWLFPGVKFKGAWTGGKPGDKPLHRLQAACRKVGLERVTFESLRRYFLEYAAPSVDVALGTPLPAHSSSQAPSLDGNDVVPASARPGPHFDSRPGSGNSLTSRPRRRRPRPFDVDMAARLMGHLLRHSVSWEGHRLYAVVGLALYTGRRRAEILKLKISDCDLGRRELRIPRRRIPIHLCDEAAKILEDWLPYVYALEKPVPWVFPGTKLEGPWVGGRLGGKPLEQLKAAGRAVGAECIGFESLRKLHLQHAKRVDLGDALRAQKPPVRSTDGPQPRPPGPPPGRRRLQDGPIAWPAPVVLKERHEPPIVLGRAKPLLSKSAYIVVRALIDAGPNGLSKAELRVTCGDSIGILRRLRTDPDWERVIRFPSDDGRRGYRIVDPAVESHQDL